MLFKTSIFFLQNQRIELIVWPGNSPDLNPIENIWAIIKMKLREYKVDKRDLLIKTIKKLWGEISIDLFQELARSMPRCIQECLARNGASTKC